MLTWTFRPLLRDVNKTLALGLFALATTAGCDIQTTSSGGGDLSSQPADMAPAIKRFGMVRLGGSSYQSGTGQMIKSSSAIAVFVDPSSQGSSCTHTVASSCSLYRCTGAGVGFVAPNPGVITVTAASQAVATLNPRTDGSYAEFNDSTQVFPVGSATTITAGGTATTPMFSGDVTFGSAAFKLLTPDPTPLQLNATVSTKADFTVTWEKLAAGSKVRVELTQGTSSNTGLYLTCEFDGAQGTGAVPVALLKNLTATTGGNNYAGLWIGPSATRTVTKSDWQIDLIALGVGRTGLAMVTDN